MAITTVLWYFVGYSLCFSGDVGGVIGNLNMVCLHGVTPSTLLSSKDQIPLIIFIAYQMMFAIITPALITGAFADRVSFKAYLIFLVVWQLFVYFPLVHMVWGGGILQQWGVLDFAGGIVVHASAGMAALASVLFVGKRREKSTHAHSIPMVALGTGLLWFGWYGFNAGSELRVDGITGLAFLNTDIAASFAAATWMLFDWVKYKKPKFTGLLTGAVAGLATVTPGAGYISTTSAVMIGIISCCVCYFVVDSKNKYGIDDALDVFGVHGVGGILGTILLGIFASKAVNAGGANGLLLGNVGFFAKELISVVGAGLYAFIFTYVMLFLINKITPVRVSEKEETFGLDAALHGEQAYQ